MIVGLATGQTAAAVPPKRNEAAAELGRKGGAARAKKLTKKQRVEIAKKGAKERWRENA